MSDNGKVIQFPALGVARDGDFWNWLGENSVPGNEVLVTLRRWLVRLQEIEAAAAELRADLFALVDEALQAVEEGGDNER